MTAPQRNESTHVSRTLIVRLDEDELAHRVHAAKRGGVNVSELVRTLLTGHFAGEDRAMTDGCHMCSRPAVTVNYIDDRVVGACADHRLWSHPNAVR